MGDNIKEIAATNRVDILDPALLRSGRIDRKIEFPLPNEDGRARIMQIHSRTMHRRLQRRAAEGGVRRGWYDCVTEREDNDRPRGLYGGHHCCAGQEEGLACLLRLALTLSKRRRASVAQESRSVPCL